MSPHSPPYAVPTAVFLGLLAAVNACQSGGPATPAPAPTTITARPVEYEAHRGVYAFEFTTEHVVIVDTVPAAPGAAWSVVARAYADLGLPRGEAREGNTTYGVSRVTVRRSLAGVPLARFLRCGITMGTPNANTYDVTLSLISRLTPAAPSGTVVQSQLVAFAQQTGVTSNPLPCTSTRELEKRVARLIDYHAAKRQ